jgi:LPS sulfotransferase NodH
MAWIRWRRKPTRFVIAGTPRSGTTWLVSALNAHPDVFCAGELLDDPHLADNPRFAADPWAGLPKVFESSLGNKAAVGFKIFYFHCWDYHKEHAAIWDRLRDDTDLRVIHFTRTNLLRLVLSWEMARKTDRWALGAGDAPIVDAPRCMLPVPELLRKFSEVETGLERMRDVFQRHHQFSLTYETLFADTERAMGEVEAFIGVQRRFVRGAQRKQETRTLREAIANYDEVAAALSATRYAHFLEP